VKAPGFILLVAVIATCHGKMNTPAPRLSALEPLPDVHGYAGMFAGVSGGALLCAGGANFPDKPLSQGGKKVWHDQVFVLEAPDQAWRAAGRLPRANGYGVSATWRDGIVLAGGGDANANFRECRMMRWDGRQLTFLPLPSLPAAVANACGALVGDSLFIAGGQETPSATSTLARCFVLDLAAAERAWREVPWPRGAPGRVLGVAAALDGWFYLFSGTDLYAGPTGAAERRYLNDAWRYREDAGWQRLADLPHAVVAAPSPAMAAGRGNLAIAGGVWPEYLAAIPPNAPHPGFSRGMLVYDSGADRWISIEAGGLPPGAPPRVTAPLVAWRDRHVVTSGEVAPGVRTPSVLTFRFPP